MGNGEITQTRHNNKQRDCDYTDEALETLIGKENRVKEKDI